MARSVSGQDEPNSALWLATRTGKRALSCPLSISCCVLQENSVLFPKYYHQDGWTFVLFFFFFASLRTSTLSLSINMQKELGQYPAILTSCFIKNPYVLALRKCWEKAIAGCILEFCCEWFAGVSLRASSQWKSLVHQPPSSSKF